VVVLLLCIAVELLSGALRAAIMNRTSNKPSWRQTWSDKLFAKKDDRTQVAVAAPATSINPPWSAERVNRVLVMATIVILTVLSWLAVDLSLREFRLGLTDPPSTPSLPVPPSSRAIAADTFLRMLGTLKLAFAATCLGAVLAIPIGVAAARNVVMNKWVNST